MKKVLVVLLFPLLAIVWMIGWLCYVVAEEKANNGKEGS